MGFKKICFENQPLNKYIEIVKHYIKHEMVIKKQQSNFTGILINKLEENTDK